MAQLASVHVEGFTELQKAFRKAGDRSLVKHLRKAHREIGRIVVKRMRQEAPVDTGQLAKSGKVSLTQKGVFVYTDRRIEYAARIHWDNKGKRVADPYLHRALDREAQRIFREYDEKIVQSLKEADLT